MLISEHQQNHLKTIHHHTASPVKRKNLRKKRSTIVCQREDLRYFNYDQMMKKIDGKLETV